MLEFSHIRRDLQRVKKNAGFFSGTNFTLLFLGTLLALLVFPPGRAFSLSLPGFTQPSSCDSGEVGVCIAPEPLTLTQNKIYWRNFADYDSRRLSVDFTINRKTSGFCVNIVGTINTEGVTTETVFPLGVGSLSASGSIPFTLRYHVPDDKGVFKTTVYAEEANACGTYPFPARYPGRF